MKTNIRSNGCRRSITPTTTTKKPAMVDFAALEKPVTIKRYEMAEYYGLKHVPEMMFRRLAETCDETGRFEIQIKVKLFPFELMALARKARHTGRAMDDLISDFITGDGPESDNLPGIIETLRDYENTVLPEKV